MLLPKSHSHLYLWAELIRAARVKLEKWRHFSLISPSLSHTLSLHLPSIIAVTSAGAKWVLSTAISLRDGCVWAKGWTERNHRQRMRNGVWRLFTQHRTAFVFLGFLKHMYSKHKAVNIFWCLQLLISWSFWGQNMLRHTRLRHWCVSSRVIIVH